MENTGRVKSLAEINGRPFGAVFHYGGNQMVVYRLTFADIEHGKVVAWKRNKPEIRKFVNMWKRKFPLRELVLTDRIEVPTAKQEFVDWLNANVQR
jgi:hypothetical protein